MNFHRLDLSPGVESGVNDGRLKLVGGLGEQAVTSAEVELPSSIFGGVGGPVPWSDLAGQRPAIGDSADGTSSPFKDRGLPMAKIVPNS